MVYFLKKANKMSKDEICKHCHHPIKIRNQSGYCDHLYWPDNCKTCKEDYEKEQAELQNPEKADTLPKDESDEKDVQNPVLCEIKFTKNAIQDLERMAFIMNIKSKADVVKEACSLLRYILQEKSKGGKLIIQKSNGDQYYILLDEVFKKYNKNN